MPDHEIMNSDIEIIAPNKYRNNKMLVSIGEEGWESAKQSGLLEIPVHFKENEILVDIRTGHEFINLCSCSYLGLGSHPAILQGAIDALKNEKTLHIAMSSLRIRLELKDIVEEGLSSLFNVKALHATSASTAIAGILPLIASGHLTDGKPLAMIFDRFCHFSMAYMKPACGDEGLVIECPNTNDLNFIEDTCKKYRRVAYVTDGVFSMGGIAALTGLFELQEKYGLFLFFDDSHSISLAGKYGEGFVRSEIKGELNENTLIVGSLYKGFGANGSVIMLGPKKHADTVRRYGGPLAWSHDMNAAGLGAVNASIKIHRSPELGILQNKLQENVAFFDSLVETKQSGQKFPIRMIHCGETELAVRASEELFKRGFYSSAVYFPIVARGHAGLRVMIRANLAREDIARFCKCQEEVFKEIKKGK